MRLSEFSHQFFKLNIIKFTWLITADPDGIAADAGADPAFPRTAASDVVVAGPDGTRANEFEENDSDREPSKSISGLIDVAGTAVQREDKTLSSHLQPIFTTKIPVEQ